MPILALAFIMANRHRLALYGEGKFQADIDDSLSTSCSRTKTSSRCAVSMSMRSEAQSWMKSRER